MRNTTFHWVFGLMMGVLILRATPMFANTTVLCKLSERPSRLHKTLSVSETTGIARIDDLLQDLPHKVEPLFADPAARYQSTSLDRWIRFTVTDSLHAHDLVARLKDRTMVSSVYINHTLRVHRNGSGGDPLRSSQWALDRVGADSAWAIERGQPSVPIAVIDTGIDTHHPDLVDNIWINSSEDLNGNGRLDAADLNGIDEDGNGFVDDVIGWDFTDAGNYPDGGDYRDRDNDPSDEMGHGTAVAGIISATGDNGVGISGLAPGCRVMPLRSFTSRGLGEEDDTAAAILYAVQNGARVINMSWGDVFITPLLDDVIQYAYSQGVVMVASAGNAGSDAIHYPSAHQQTLSVGATTSDDLKAGFSNYGSTLDIVAPGENVLSTIRDAQYDSSLNGTSFAAPYVSAAAALLISQDAGLTPDAVKGILLASADDLGSMGWDGYYAAGRLNVHHALKYPVQAIAYIASPALDDGFQSGPVTLYGTAWSPTMESYQLFYGIGEHPDSWTSIGPPQPRRVMDDVLGIWEELPQAEGSVMIRLTVKNRDGSEIQSNVRIFVDHSPPQISDVRILPMWDGPERSALILFQTDDLCEARLHYRPRGSVQAFESVRLSYRARELSTHLTRDIVSGAVECWIEAINRVGLCSRADNDGEYYHIDLSTPPISRVLLTPRPWSLPYGYLLNVASDFNDNGRPELVLNPLQEETLQHSIFFEFDGTQFVPMASMNRLAIPRDVSSRQGGGQSFLAGYGFSSFLWQPDSGAFPGQSEGSDLTQWQGDASTGYWASQLGDLDQDGHTDILMRLTSSEDSGFQDEFQVWEEQADHSFSVSQTLTNPTSGENRNGVPHSELGDLDGDGYMEILIGDSDGDVYLYETTGDNRYEAIWQDTLPLVDTIDYIEVGDFNGDGQDEFAVGCHSSGEEYNSEHDYDARHWLYRIYESTADNTYRVVAEWRFFGYESAKDFYSGVSSGDIDGDGQDELALCVFPDLYLVDMNDMGEYELSFHYTPVRSHGALFTDADGDGQTELWIGTGEETLALQAVGGASGPAAPVGLSAQPLGPDRVSLSWYAVPGADTYQVLRGQGPAGVSILATVTQLSFVDTTVVSDSVYHYTVVAIDSSRSPVNSLPSNSVSAHPGPNPWVVDATVENEQQVRIHFSQPMNASVRIGSHYAIAGADHAVSTVAEEAGNRHVLLTLDGPLVSGQDYDITVRGVADQYNVPLDTLRSSASISVLNRPRTPYLVAGNVIDAETLELVFNEPMDLETLLDPQHYDLGADIVVKHALAVAGTSDRVRLRLFTPNGFGALGTTYVVRVTDVTNKSGVPVKTGRGDVLHLIFSRQTLDSVFTFPNPWRPGLGVNHIRFANLTPEAVINIMTIHGRPIRTLYERNGDGGIRWDLNDEDGQAVSSGVYIYRITYGNQSCMGKLAVIR